MMDTSQIIERLAEAVSDASETVKVLTPTPCYYSDGKPSEDKIEIINASLLARYIYQLADELRQIEVQEGII